MGWVLEPRNIGVDCESVAKWRDLLVRNPEQLETLFYPCEHSHCLSYADSAEVYAGLWCAKEAVCKAFGGLEKLLPRAVIIDHHSDGRPVARLVGRPRGEYAIDVSISHCEICAMAAASVTRAKARRSTRMMMRLGLRTSEPADSC